ncbi:DUF3576 domain-containing protein [Alphaproteobacteria bacterium GH1-50]|uniref:DUF3576 domain-containing protein n=1 Tax=Kangsaoukella pontilimi TaxID=2691042 RepID=A0A7C9IS54_9RHOB|nr:DUF3576 domain-containing protein [Kangsaoukella pontilimi]MXQ09443.1 DUF3576 domain-containing protein [Kangsaoukella pontilimi]
MGVQGALGRQLARIGKPAAVLALALVLAGCGMFGGNGTSNRTGESAADREVQDLLESGTPQDDLERSTLADLFVNIDDPDTTIEVNKYLWNASLDILNFLPLQSADPFTGVIVTGYGTPPGGGRAYRATIFVRDPALEARSLTVALATRSGPASTETVRAVEDAILTRARQLRIRDLNL